MRSGPVRGPGFCRSPGDPVYDPIWARLAEAGHPRRVPLGRRGLRPLRRRVGRSAATSRRSATTRSARVTGGHRPIYDTIAALVCHGVFTRHPNLRVATIESGSDWVPLLLRDAEEVVRRRCRARSTASTRSQQVRDHVWVSPYYEDDLAELRDELGADRMIFGSDYPHAEGLADPLAFVDDLPGFSDDEIRLVMRENALELSVPRT